MQSSCSQILQLKTQEKPFPPEIQKAFLHFWQVMWVNSSKLKTGRSLSSLPTKCQQWGRQICLSVRISWEGQLSVKLEIDDPQTSCSIWGKQQIQGTAPSKGDPEPSKMGWESWASDLWLIWVWHLSQSSQGMQPVPEFTWKLHPWSNPHWGQAQNGSA